jgi:hypothetical protein
MGGKAILVLFIGVVIISTKIFDTINRSSADMSSNTEKTYLVSTAKNIAQTGVTMGLRQIANDRTWRTGLPDMDLMGGRVVVTASDTVFDGLAAVKVSAKSIVGNAAIQQVSATSTAFVRATYYPLSFQGALSTKNPVSFNGAYTIDGRDHTPAGVLIPNKGVYGIWTTKTANISGNAKVGGTAASVDYAPAKPPSAEVVKQNQPWAGGYPGTPDSVFGGARYGFPEGALKAIAMSGIGGSQYVTNPNNLTYPLSGVTYVELPSNGSWLYSNTLGTGLLIVHNNAANASLSEQTGSKFVGVVIADDFSTLKGDIIGALVSLTPWPAAGTTGGNSNGTLLYSKKVVTDITDMLYYLGGQKSESFVMAWRE